MRKFILILIIHCLLLIPNARDCIAQSITWQKTYGGTLRDVGYSIVQTPDEGYIAVGRAEPFGILAMRLNKFGDVIWTRYFNGFTAVKIEATNDGNYIILGSFSELYKININGDTLWTRRTDLTRRTKTVKQTSDNGYILCGSIDNGPYTVAPYLLKVNSQGVFQWERTYSSGIGDGKFADVTISNDDGFIFCGNYSPGQDTIYDYLFIMKTDDNGNQIWFRGYDTLRYRYVSSIVNAVNNGFIAGAPNLYKFDTLGYIQWFKSYSESNYSTYSQLINNFDRNSYTLVGWWDSTGNLSSYVRLMKVDTAGNMLWRKTYGIEGKDAGKGLTQTSDSGYIIIGLTWIGNGPEDIYIIKTDKTGNTSPYIGIRPISSGIPTEFKLLQNYPNPFNPKTSIKYEIPKDAQVTLKIYDIAGREILNISEYKQAGSYSYMFDGTNLASGIYLYKLETEGYVSTRKMVLMK